MRFRVIWCLREIKKPPSRQGRGVVSWCHPGSPPGDRMGSFAGTAAERIAAMPYTLITVVTPAEPTGAPLAGPFGRRLPGPFAGFGDTGSHLARLSEPPAGRYSSCS